MREWRRHWVVRVRRTVPGGWPITEVRAHRADTPAELRAIIEAARADPRVLAFAHESRRELEGDEPTTCHRGHRYGSGRHNMRRDWLPCGCGGHVAYFCLIKDNGVECGDQRIEPVVLYDCDATWPKSVGPRSHLDDLPGRAT